LRGFVSTLAYLAAHAAEETAEDLNEADQAAYEEHDGQNEADPAGSLIISLGSAGALQKPRKK